MQIIIGLIVIGLAIIVLYLIVSIALAAAAAVLIVPIGIAYVVGFLILLAVFGAFSGNAKPVNVSPSQTYNVQPVHDPALDRYQYVAPTTHGHGSAAYNECVNDWKAANLSQPTLDSMCDAR